MTVPTRAQLESLPTIKFPANNTIVYSEDFGFYRGIPHGVDWYIAEVENGTVTLVREGHGVKENYGNGSLLVNASGILGFKQRID